VYHLIRATGREQIAQNTVNESASNTDYRNFPYDAVTPLPAPTDNMAMRPYTQLYAYDPAGNMTKLQHVAGTGSYTRVFAFNNNTADRTAFGVSPSAVMNNQLLATTLGGSPAVKYAYDEHGNTTGLVQLASIAWNSKDQLVSSVQQVVSSGSGQTTWYTYDESGTRTRKITLRASSGGAPPTVLYERLYLGNFEIYRSYDPTGKLILERETLHIIDDKNRVATIDKKTLDTGGADPATLNAYYPRYQYGNHLGSAGYELDEAANIITYEEYHPFGTTSFESADTALEVPAKRYRYIGKERDEETGLCYHGARYYAPWLARWLSSDPIGLAGGLNLYTYCTNNPIMHRDEDGMQEADPPCHTSCHSSPQKFDKSLLTLPPLTAEDAEKWFIPPEKQKEIEEQRKAQEDAALTDTLTQIKIADEKSGTGTVCQTGCHALRGLKNVHGDPKQMNEDAALFVKVVGYELMIVGGAEGLATKGLLEGVLLPAAESAAKGYGTTHILMASGVDKDTAEWTGFAASIFLPGSLSSFKGAPKLKAPSFDPPGLWKPEPGKEVFIGEWLNRNLQQQVDTTVDRFVADPRSMAHLVPPGQPYRAIPQFGGLVIEYGTKDSIAQTPILRDIIDPVSARSQFITAGGQGDLQLNASFQQWGLKQWDITTPAEAARKMAAGKDYTFLLYNVDWAAIGKKVNTP